MTRNLPSKKGITFAGIPFRGYSYPEGIHVPIVDLQQIVRVKGITIKSQKDIAQEDAVNIVDSNRRTGIRAVSMFYPESNSIIYTIPRSRTWFEIFPPQSQTEAKRGKISLPV